MPEMDTRISITMIEEYDFKKQRNGYDIQQVDDLLDRICDTLESYQNELANAHAEVLRLKDEARERQAGAVIPIPTPVPAASRPADPFARPDDSVKTGAAAQKLLENAQKMYDSMIAEAKQEAEKIVSEARNGIGGDIEYGQLMEEKENLVKQIEELKHAAKDYRNRFIRLVEDQQHVLNSETELFN